MLIFKEETGLRDLSRKVQLKLIGREIISYLFDYSGILKLIYSIFNRKKALILCYHRVIDLNELPFLPQPGMYVKKKTFDMHMRFLKENFNVVPLSNIIQKVLSKQEFEDKTCAITFDDGWRDNYVHAYPILKKLQLPATIFLTTNVIDTSKCFWSEKINYLLNNIMRDKKLNKILLSGSELFRKVNNEFLYLEDRIDFIIEQMKGMKLEGIEKIVGRLKEISGNRNIFKSRIMLSWKEIEEMSNYNITFGSHGANHIILTNLDEKELRSEVTGSLEEISKRNIAFLPFFCYPNGDYSEAIKKTVANVGYKCALSIRKGFLKPSDDPFMIPRISIHDDIAYTKAMFSYRLTGIS